MRKKKWLFLVNILLFLVIACIVFTRLYRAKVFSDWEYGKHPGELLEIAAENFPGTEEAVK